ncbi:hypothetical protein M1271_01920 [Patescibacteria group bacterium]|nr:hypothetical protein [Patescibacteria group bacterium]
MRNTVKAAVCLIFLTFFFFSSVTKTSAAADCNLIVNPRPPLTAPVNSISLKFDGAIVQQELSKYPSGGQLVFSFPENEACGNPVVSDPNNPVFSTNNNGICGPFLTSPGTHSVELIYKLANQNIQVCNISTITINALNPTCKIEANYTGLGDVDDASWKVVASDIKNATFFVPVSIPGFSISIPNPLRITIDGNQVAVESPTSTIEEPIPINLRTAGQHNTSVYQLEIDPTATAVSIASFGVMNATLRFLIDHDLLIYKNAQQMCSTTFEIAPKGATPNPTSTPILTPTIPSFCSLSPCNTGTCSNGCNTCPGCPGAVHPTVAFVPDIKPLCDQLDPQYQSKCSACLASGRKMWTAIGCIPLDFTALIKDYIFTTGVGMAGGISFLYFIYGAFMILTSAGNTEQIEEARQIIISSLSGLFLIIFSVFLLKFIGVDIFKIPGFG